MNNQPHVLVFLSSEWIYIVEIASYDNLLPMGSMPTGVTSVPLLVPLTMTSLVPTSSRIPLLNSSCRLTVHCYASCTNNFKSRSTAHPKLFTYSEPWIAFYRSPQLGHTCSPQGRCQPSCIASWSCISLLTESLVSSHVERTTLTASHCILLLKPIIR